jgi:hypothetical protein
MSLSTRTMLHRGTAGLRICLSLLTLTLLLLIMAGALAGIGIRQGTIHPPQGGVSLGLVAFYAQVPDCPTFPRCFVRVPPGGSEVIPELYASAFSYTVSFGVPGLHGPKFYRIMTIPVEPDSIEPGAFAD